MIATVAGNGIFGSTGDGGLATSAELSGPVGVAVDPGGHVYITESRIRKISDQTISTVSKVTAYGIAVASNDDIYVTQENAVLKISNGTITDNRRWRIKTQAFQVTAVQLPGPNSTVRSAWP